jgi:hypothetical protein
MKASEADGLFWLPEEPSRSVAGTLSYSTEAGIDLALFGSLGSLPATLPATRVVPLIHGLVWNSAIGPQVTLEDCRLSGLSLNAPGIARERYRISRLLAGSHLLTDDFLFERINLRFSGLCSWAEMLSGLDTRVQDRVGGNKEFTLRWSRPAPFRGDLPGGKFLLGASARSNFSSRDFSLVEDITFEIQPVQPASLDDLSARYVYPLQNFLTLATDRPNAIVDYNVSRGGRDTPILIVEKYLFSDEAAAADLLPYKMLFTLRDIAERLPHFLSRWIEMSAELTDFLGAYFSAYYSSPTFVELQFLLAAQSLETYARARLDTASDGAERGFGEILKALLARHRNSMESLFGPDIDAAAKTFDRWRNFAVHPHKPPTAEYIEPLHYSTQRLVFLAKVCMLSELGFSTEEISMYLNRNQHYLQVVRQRNAEGS